jgi:hypothetical protein
MILFYIIEAVAIYTVLKQHPHDADAAVHPLQISFPVALPQLVSGGQGLQLHLFDIRLSYCRRAQPGTR